MAENVEVVENIALQIWKLLDTNKVPQAAELCQKLNRSYPNSAEGWHLASHAAERARLMGKALEFIQHALALEPTNSGYLMQHATVLLRIGRLDEGLKIAHQLAGSQQQSAAAYNMLGSTLAHYDLHEDALQAFDEAIALSGNRAHYHFNRAAELRFLGRLQEAEAACNRCINLNPRYYEAYLIRSDLRKQSAVDNHVAELQQMLPQTAKDWRGQTQLYYALAKEMEDIGEYQTSFECRRSGAGVRRKQMVYHPQTDLDTMLSISEAFGESEFAEITSTCRDNSALFVLGLPRTGTTLLERILGSHTQVHGAGELNNFAQELVRLSRQKFGNADSRDKFVEHSRQISFGELGEAYIRSTELLRGGCPRFIDKLPLNYLYTGLIHLALPKARIIHLRRHPMASCYAIYKQLFQDAYPFSYSLEELGHYYVAYSRLMDHWRRLIPEAAMIDVHYENLVTNTETETRRILDFCDLEWEGQCLEFYKQKTASTTASAAQVREPAHTRSIDQWRHYEQQLEPLREILQAGGVMGLD